MAGRIDKRLSEMGITLPAAAAPVANYVPTVEAQGFLYVSGQIPRGPDGPIHVGKVGGAISVREGAEAARACALSVIAQVKAAIGDLDRVKRIVKVVGFVNSTPEFDQQPVVVNGASDLFVEVFGDAGRHARSAVGVAALPAGVAVEVEAVVEIA
jgi:enamine deaminase RidA (YjgF/YER057c/UK114 family)